MSLNTLQTTITTTTTATATINTATTGTIPLFLLLDGVTIQSPIVQIFTSMKTSNFFYNGSDDGV
jgi:hypothetical protein